MYVAALVIPASIISQFINAIPVVVVTLTGFGSEKDDADAVDDDRINRNYHWGAGSVWAFRCFTSFFIAILTLSAFYAMYRFELTKSLTAKLNEIVKQREKQKISIYETLPQAEDPHSNVNVSDSQSKPEYQPHTLELQLQPLSTSVEEGKNETTALISSEDQQTDSIDMIIDEHQRQLLLHLSILELYCISSTMDVSPSTINSMESSLPQSSHPSIASTRGFVRVQNYVTKSLLVSVIGIALCIAALVLDSQYLDGTFSTLLIYILLLTFFYSLYEMFRYVAMLEMQHWPTEQLHRFAKCIFHELNTELETIHDMLAKEHHVTSDIDIHIADSNTTSLPPSDELNEQQSSVDSNKIVFEIDAKIEQINKKSIFTEDHIEDQAFRTLLGYEYVVVGFALIIGFAIFVIIFSVTSI